MNPLDLSLVALSLAGALLLGCRAVRSRSHGGCGSAGRGKISSEKPAPCAGCRSALRTADPRPTGR